jgi:hypothetical protein
MSEARGQLFHGTIENLKPGDIVEPLGGKNNRAYATSDLKEAEMHTQRKLSTGFSSRTMEQKNPHHGKIYEVEPLEGDSTLQDASKAGDFQGAVHSEKGFRVSRQLASVLKPKG